MTDSAGAAAAARATRTTRTSRGAAAEPLGARALNRALLARQFLLERASCSAAAAIEHLVGLQAQAPNAPYVGLWTRLDPFTHDDLATLLTTRAAVRIVLMRGTIHLVSARDCLGLRPLVQSVLARGLQGTFGRRLAGLDLDEVGAVGRRLVEREPLTWTALGARLAERWPDRDGDALAMAVRTMVPLVQLPPRGVWGQGGPAIHTSAEAWLDGRPARRRGARRATAAAITPAQIVLRYLAAFGPASVSDVQAWSGLTRLREAIEPIRPALRTFRRESGDELFDLPDAPRPDPDTPAPPRFLPEYDNLLLSHADRSHVIADEHRARVFAAGALLVDGVVRGAWKIAREARRRGSRESSGGATLLVEPFGRLSRADRVAVEEEGARLLAFAAGDAARRDVRFGPFARRPDRAAR